MNFTIRLVAVAVLLLLAEGAHAFRCTVVTTPVNFGYYDLFSLTDLSSSGTVTVNCNNQAKNPLTVTLSLNAGSGSVGQRQMSSTTAGALYYNLYTDSARSIVFGDGSGGSANMSNDMSKLDPWNVTVYGRIPALQNVLPGVYSDIITATVIW